MADTTPGDPGATGVPDEHRLFVPPDDAGVPWHEPAWLEAPPDVFDAPAERPALPEGILERRPPPEPKRRTRGGFWRLAGVALASGLIGAALAATAVWWLLGDDDPVGAASEPVVTIVERVSTEILSPEASGTTASAVARRVLPSIVTVEIGTQSDEGFLSDGSGSGVVLETSGLLVTNEHVVEGAEAVRVVFADGRIYEAEVVGADALTDLALIRIDALGLTAVELGSAEGLRIGDTAIAVGSPLGLQGGPSVTVGVVSAFDRRVRTAVDSELFGLLQTDAPITRGSSGGALVDAEGRLIGITTAIGISDVGAEGLGFAVPVEMMQRIIDDLREYGEARHAFLGITGTTFFDEGDDGSSIPSGVVIASVVEGSAAELAGLRPDDVIQSFDGIPVFTMEQLVVRVRLYRINDVIDVALERGGEAQMVEVTLLERPEGV